MRLRVRVLPGAPLEILYTRNMRTTRQQTYLQALLSGTAVEATVTDNERGTQPEGYVATRFDLETGQFELS